MGKQENVAKAQQASAEAHLERGLALVEGADADTVNVANARVAVADQALYVAENDPKRDLG